MLAINAGEGQEAVTEFLKNVPIDFPSLLGNVDSLPNWSVRALPTTIVWPAGPPRSSKDYMAANVRREDCFTKSSIGRRACLLTGAKELGCMEKVNDE